MPRDEPMVSQWSPLKCKNVPDGVKLYYDFSNSATGMFMAVTDLCSIWDLSFDQEGVVEIARAQNCSIDPAESGTQLRTLLNKLKQSLLEGSNGIGYSEHRYEGENHGYLSVRTRLKLPAPLKLLQWTFYLPQRDNVTLAESVTFPLLREATIMKQQMETLYLAIKDKDHVLSKLLDKIDNSAIDLSLMFPGITGMKSRKQRIDVAEASKHVPGMATFDRTSWEAGIAKSHDEISSGNIDLSNILDCSKTNTTTAIPSANWFLNLPLLDEDARSLDRSGSETGGGVQEIAPRRKKPDEAMMDNSGSSTDSVFEDLADTPRRQRRQTEQPMSSSSIPASNLRYLLKKRRTSDSSCGSDSDNAIRRAATASTKASSKIGMLGGKRKASPSPSSSPPDPVPLNTSTPSRKLGVLGGRRATTKSSSKSPVPVRTRSETPDAPDNGADSDRASSTSSTPASQKRPTKSPTKAATPPPVREEPQEVEESVEERAKRKREELRSQAQTNAGLAKKKVRRF